MTILQTIFVLLIGSLLATIGILFPTLHGSEILIVVGSIWVFAGIGSLSLNIFQNVR